MDDFHRLLAQIGFHADDLGLVLQVLADAGITIVLSGVRRPQMNFNPDPSNRDETLTALVPSRVEQFADELAMPVDRVAAWGFVKAVLSDVWSAEGWSSVSDRSPISRALDVARLLLPRLP